MPVPGIRARRRVVVAMWVVLWVGFVGALVAGRAAGGRAEGARVLASAALLAVGLALAVGYARAARVRGGLVPPMVQASADPRPVAVPDRVPSASVRACMRCGSRDLALPGIRDGAWVGGAELQFMVCRNCNTRAPPLEFERGEDYVAFVRELHADAATR